MLSPLSVLTAGTQLVSIFFGSVSSLLSQGMQTRVAVLLIVINAASSYALPLSTSSRWIVNESTGERVKLACVNWASHLEPMLPEGLHKRPLPEIASQISLMEFNCVRLTYATHMFTRHAHLTVEQNFHNLGLNEAIASIAKNNPHFLSLTLADAQRAVVEELGSHGIMVVLDNHVSYPIWCCSSDDGNGFFGDKYFDPKEWLQGLSMVSTMYKDTPKVVAMSLRNELRGPLQNVNVWYNYITEGAETIYRVNPNVLIIVSGLSYDLDFRFLKNRPLRLDIGNKLVYEVHRYSFTGGTRSMWENNPLNKFCAMVIQDIEDKAGFLFKGEDAAPLFVSEFGIAQLGESQGDNLFMGCFLNYLAENDLDWAVWSLQGSYYIKRRVHDPEETYAMFNYNWSTLRSPEFLSRMQLIQQKIQDPYSKEENYLIMYHALSGKCARVDHNEVHVSDCWELSKWIHEGNGTPIRLKGTDLCLTAVGDGLPVALTNDCVSQQSSWKLALNSQYQLANQGENGTDLCLEWDPHHNGKVLTNKCIVSGEGDARNLQNPQSQWFKLIIALGGSPARGAGFWCLVLAVIVTVF